MYQHIDSSLKMVQSWALITAAFMWTVLGPAGICPQCMALAQNEEVLGLYVGQICIQNHWVVPSPKKVFKWLNYYTSWMNEMC